MGTIGPRTFLLLDVYPRWWLLTVPQHPPALFTTGRLVALLARSPMDRRIAVALALVVSAVGFAAAHHVGAHGEPFTMHALCTQALRDLWPTRIE